MVDIPYMSETVVCFFQGSVLKDFATAMMCEPCAVCQMTKELDHIGL